MSSIDFTGKAIIAAVLMLAPAHCRAQTEAVPAASDIPSETQETALRHEGQGPSQNAQKGEICGVRHLRVCVKDVLKDQAGILTSPLRLHARDAVWLVPFGGATAASLYYDSDALQQLGYSKSRIDISRTIGHFGAPYTTIGTGAALYAIGAFGRNDHLAETGRLGIEAVVDASILVGEIKLVSNRERPREGLGTGRFWPDGIDDYRVSRSFPSGHAAASWAFAHVIAAEYPNWFVRIGAYSFATAISISRVTSRQHFPSDAVVGSVLGYLIGGYVVHHHSAKDTEPRFTIAPYADESSRTLGVRIDIPLKRGWPRSVEPSGR